MATSSASLRSANATACNLVSHRCSIATRGRTNTTRLTPAPIARCRARCVVGTVIPAVCRRAAGFNCRPLCSANVLCIIFRDWRALTFVYDNGTKDTAPVVITSSFCQFPRCSAADIGAARSISVDWHFRCISKILLFLSASSFPLLITPIYIPRSA